MENGVSICISVFAGRRRARQTLAHAVLTPDVQGGYNVSIRAPLARPTGADALCSGFPTGGGRAAAAGINHLPADRLDVFLRRLETAFA